MHALSSWCTRVAFFLVALVLLLFGETPLASEPAPARPYRKVYALVVGNNTYPDGWKRLRYAEADATAVASVLRTNFLFEVTVLVGSKATKMEIDNALGSIEKLITSEDDFIFYFSGHGANGPDDADKHGRRGFLIPYGARLPSSPPRDAKERKLFDREAFDATALVERLPLWHARHRIVLLDSCFGGAAGRGGIARSGIPGNLGNAMTSPTVQVLTAGTEGEEVIELDNVESKRVAHGLFTFMVLEVLRRDNSQSVLNLFLQVRDGMNDLAAKKYSGHVSTAQHRMVRLIDGEFVFIPGPLHGTWMTAYTQEADLTHTAQRGYDRPVTESEYTNVLAQAQSGSVTVSKEDMDRFEARAAMGDPVAMATVTEIFGSRASPGDKQRARRWAQDGYDTGNPFGVFALSRVYRRGYGVEQNGTEAASLEKQSGLGRLGELLRGWDTLALGVGGLSGSYSPGAVPDLAGQVSAVGKGAAQVGKTVTSLLGGGSNMSGRVKDMRKALEAKKGPNWKDLSKAIDKLRKDLDSLPVGDSKLKSTVESELKDLEKAVEAGDAIDAGISLRAIEASIGDRK